MKNIFIKTVCLGLGLAIGLLLIAKVYFEQTYDSFYPHVDRIYKASECFTMNGEYKEFGLTSGAIGPGIKAYAPQVEAATRFKYLTGSTAVITDDKRTFTVKAICLADSCLFDVLPRRIIAGNYKEVLATPGRCMVPRSLAEKIGGNVVGSRLAVPLLSTVEPLVIGGVYDDYPLNSDVPQSIYLSLKSIGNYMGNDTGAWLGNDSYNTYVRLAKHTSSKKAEVFFDQMLRNHIDKETLTTYNYKIKLTPLRNLHLTAPTVKTTIWILTLLATLLLTVATLNYLLIVFNQMVGRSKEMAIRKCYGTSSCRIIGMVLRESALHLAMSLILAVALLYIFHSEVETLLGATVGELLFNRGMIGLTAGVCVVILLITGVLPGCIYARIPVSAVFRHYNASRRVWKRSLLAIQFVATSFFVLPAHSHWPAVWPHDSRRPRLQLPQPAAHQLGGHS